MNKEKMDPETKRLQEAAKRTVDWKKWGPYISDRAWGTVREDYSADGAAWDYFPFEHAHMRTYRWNEDGIAGICDRKQRICFALSFWNGNDAILKERFFGLSGPTGNHGEDVKEIYCYLDSTPTHSFMKFLYKYPQNAYPYELLYRENTQRDKAEREFELIDTGIFTDSRYFDISVEYAKAAEEDICIRITAFNRGLEGAPLDILPTVWFRNTWSWGQDIPRPNAKKTTEGQIDLAVDTQSNYRLFYEAGSEALFCENESNLEKLYGVENKNEYVKDGIGNYIVNGKVSAITLDGPGTKAAVRHHRIVPSGKSIQVYLRLKAVDPNDKSIDRDNQLQECETIFNNRIAEADLFYSNIIPKELSEDGKNIMRQALAGLLWSKQYYHYVIKDWLDGDPGLPPPPERRKKERNADWKHLYNDDIISMPDKWEYPWYAAWDLAFHCIPLAMVDPDFAKRQLILMLREWYMHPNGQIPAYEWALGDVNPPVHAWAVLRVYRIEAKKTGIPDTAFLEKAFHKLLLNFTWWVNRKDMEGNNVFEGGFLGLDNIGVFDRSKPIPGGGTLEQSDGTSWMAMYCLNMLGIALELAKVDKAYEDVASKFFEHFVFISDAMNNLGNEETELWNEEDGFYYDVLHLDGKQFPIKIRSLVGLIPLFAVETIDDDLFDALPDFRRRSEWLMENRPELFEDISCFERKGKGGRWLLSLVNKKRLETILKKTFDESEFLSAYGIRSLSKIHKDNPYIFTTKGSSYQINYEPAESKSGMFGGNSNWRGPIWFPVNYLLIEALQKFDFYYGEELKVEFPTHSGEFLDLWNVSQQLEKRLCSLFLRNDSGARPVFGDDEIWRSDPHWQNCLLFHEYFDGDTGRGLGANHQTGWTALIAKLLKQTAEYENKNHYNESSGN